ncbi:MAG: hypothetical protein ACI83I_000995 [Bacteroidia bacterium]|jgi:hypothetical protein
MFRSLLIGFNILCLAQLGLCQDTLTRSEDAPNDTFMIYHGDQKAGMMVNGRREGYWVNRAHTGYKVINQYVADSLISSTSFYPTGSVFSTFTQTDSSSSTYYFRLNGDTCVWAHELHGLPHGTFRSRYLNGSIFIDAHYLNGRMLYYRELDTFEIPSDSSWVTEGSGYIINRVYKGDEVFYRWETFGKGYVDGLVDSMSIKDSLGRHTIYGKLRQNAEFEKYEMFRSDSLFVLKAANILVPYGGKRRFEPAIFEEGQAAMYQFIADHIDLPPPDKKFIITVRVEFTIDEYGLVSGISIKDPKRKLKDDELAVVELAKKVVIKMSGKWHPATENGIPVEMSLILPIRVDTR